MTVEDQLAQNMTSESKAYGYTLSIWGGGTILSHVYQSPSLGQGVVYVLGALAAFGLITVIVFDQFIVESDVGSDQIPVPSMLHLVAVLGTLLGAVLLAKTMSLLALPALVGFTVVGFQVTILYNLLLPLETTAVRRAFSTMSESLSTS